MSQINISVIIPCYNVELFIYECIKSLLSSLSICKSNYNVEIICINDGSRDNTVQIINNKFKKQLLTGLIKIINKDNEGLSAARNTGVAYAQGEYISFVDGDDCVSYDYFTCIFNALKEQPDLVVFNLSRFSINHEQKEEDIIVHNKNGINLSNQTIDDEFKHGNWFACCRLYKKKLISEHKFPIGMLFEDIMTIPFLYLRNIRIYYIKNHLYLYRKNPEGLSIKIKPKHLEDMQKFYARLITMTPNPYIDQLASQAIMLYVSFALRLNLSTKKYFHAYKILNVKNPKIWNSRYSPRLFPLNHPMLYFIIKRIKFATGNFLRQELTKTSSLIK